MSEVPFHGLSPAEAERLFYLIEECGEVIKAASKVLRHGYNSTNPDDPGPDNRDMLQDELSDVLNAMRMLGHFSDIDLTLVEESVQFSGDPRWFHHQAPHVFVGDRP